jgi:hypothetical protein
LGYGLADEIRSVVSPFVFLGQAAHRESFPDYDTEPVIAFSAT